MTPITDRHVVTVLSPKGGTGKTTVATNLAVGLARRRPGDVVLADLDLAFGDVASALLLSVQRGVRDVHAGAHIDDVVVRHPSGLHVLGAPDEATPTDTDVADVIAPVIRTLAARYPVVVLDTGAGFDAVAREAVAQATDLVLVASMDVPTLLGLRKVLGWLDGLGHTAARRHLVLNRANVDVGLGADDVTATVGMDVAVSIPHDAAVWRSVNEGHALTEDDVDGPSAEALAALVALVDRDEGPDGQPDDSRSWMQRALAFGRSADS